MWEGRGMCGNMWELREWVPDLLMMIRNVDLEAVLIGETVGGCAEAMLTIDDADVALLIC